MTQIFQVSLNSPFLYIQDGGTDSTAWMDALADTTKVPIINHIVDQVVKNLELYHNLQIANYALAYSVKRDPQGDIVSMFLNIGIEKGIHLPIFSVKDSFTKVQGLLSDGLLSRCMIPSTQQSEVMILYGDIYPQSRNPVWIRDIILKYGNFSPTEAVIKTNLPITMYEDEQKMAFEVSLATQIRNRNFVNFFEEVIKGKEANRYLRSLALIRSAEYYLILARSSKTSTVSAARF